MRNVSIPALCLTVVTALAGDSRGVETQPDVQFTATVSTSEARFFFPLEERREWTWYLSTTPDNKREYEWSGEVENGETRYQFGFFLFKPQGKAPARGDFSALIRAGQTSIATAVGAAPHTRMIVLQNGRVRIAQGQGLLVLSITDPETLRTLFSERPSLVTLKVQVPGAAEVTRSVTVAYGSEEIADSILRSASRSHDFSGIRDGEQEVGTISKGSEKTVTKLALVLGKRNDRPVVQIYR